MSSPTFDMSMILIMILTVFLLLHACRDYKYFKKKMKEFFNATLITLMSPWYIFKFYVEDSGSAFNRNMAIIKSNRK